MFSKADVVCYTLETGPPVLELKRICEGASVSLLLLFGVSLCVRLAPLEFLFLLYLLPCLGCWLDGSLP